MFGTGYAGKFAAAVAVCAVLFKLAPYVDGRDPMCEAAYKEDIPQLELMLAEGEDPNRTDEWGNTPLHWACKKNSLETVYLLLNASANARAENKHGSTPLHWASTKGSSDVIRHLIASGSDVEHKNQAGETALHWAVEWLNENAVRELLKSDAEVGTQDENGNTPLHNINKDCHDDQACQRIVAALIRKKADVTVKNNFGRTSLAHFDYGKAVDAMDAEETNAESDGGTAATETTTTVGKNEANRPSIRRSK
eukprot:CAMPEP_0197521984 /NCGR_PEP_ID=MMETSP1318-20131121/7190_1 /TAXON_ID=552666 /ORGANISM="Partenskyella glossopodia, Strain RCC365" /LENGTH=251 /DNA_ID=CAMNT_0043074175 /DNA_START=33 /DNA_END=788 /DNA_ORIENTATION=+